MPVDGDIELDRERSILIGLESTLDERQGRAGRIDDAFKLIVLVTGGPDRFSEEVTNEIVEG
jgi:hypothetical protein